MFDLGLVPHGGEIEPLQVALQEVLHGAQILGLHRAKPPRRRLVGHAVFPGLELRLAVGRARAEADFIQLRPVQCAVVVPAGADGPREHNAARVNGLPRPFQVDPPGDLLDQDGSEPLASQLLVDAEEVDLGTADDVVAHAHLGWDGRDKGAEGVSTANADVPLFLPPWRQQRPGNVSHARAPKPGSASAYHFSSEFEYLNLNMASSSST